MAEFNPQKKIVLQSNRGNWTDWIVDEDGNVFFKETGQRYPGTNKINLNDFIETPEGKAYKDPTGALLQQDVPGYISPTGGKFSVDQLPKEVKKQEEKVTTVEQPQAQKVETVSQPNTEIKPQGKKLITNVSTWGKFKPDGSNMSGFADETGRVFYEDGTPFFVGDQQYQFDVTNPIKTESGNVYKDPMGFFVASDSTGWSGGSQRFIGQTGVPVTPNEKGTVTEKEVWNSINWMDVPTVQPDPTSPTGYSLAPRKALTTDFADTFGNFMKTGQPIGKPVLKDGTPYDPSKPFLPEGTDVNRLNSLLQEMSNLQFSTLSSYTPGGATDQRINEIRNEITGIVGDINTSTGLINNLSYRPTQQNIEKSLEASQNPDTSFSLSNITNAAGRLAETVGPAIAAMAVAQYALPSLLGTSAGAGATAAGATEAAALLDAAALAEGGVTAGMAAAANTGIPAGTALLGSGSGLVGLTPEFTSNSMLANLGLGTEAAAPFTPASGLPSNLFTIAPEVGQAGALTFGDDLASLAQSYPNIPVEQLQSIAEINYGLNPTTAFDAANLASSGYSPATINQVLAGSYTPTELIGTGIESMQTLPTVSQIPQYPGDEQYIQQDIMEQARATNVPSGSPTSWDTGISAAITPGQILQGARLAGGLIGGAQEQPQQIQQMPRQNIVPRGQGVDYSGIYNLLGLQRPQNRFSLLG